MTKLFRRFIAYMIDMMVILIITQSLSGIPAINKQLDDYNKYYEEYVNSSTKYIAFKGDLDKYYEDKNLTEEEYNSLTKEQSIYTDILNEYYKDNKLTKKNYDKLNKKIDKYYENTSIELYFKTEKNSILYFVIYILTVVIYFIGFNKYTNGQTLGKKLMRLKIVNNSNETKDVPVWSYIVRCLVLYQPISYIVKLIGVYFMNASMYYDVSNFMVTIQGYVEMLVLAMIMIRLDGRGLQDILANTRVALYDRNGNEIKDKFELLVNEKVKGKKVIDEEPTE